MLLSILSSLTGCILTGMQLFLIVFRGEGICFNEGCEIVDSLTLIHPFYFNLAGFFYFFLVSFSINQARKKSETWKRFASILLLAGLAAESVLFSFQFFITEIFCSYCLIIFSLVVLANIFTGPKQIFKGTVIFTAILVAFASLDFKSGSKSLASSIDDGTIAKLSIDSSERQLYLFFSSTCSHCEDVIEEMKQDITCSVNFNPVDHIDSFSFPGADFTPSYTPEINIDFLKILDLRGVPVLVDKHDNTTTIWMGSQTIKTFLELNCSSRKESVQPEQISQTSSSSFSLPEKDKDCTIVGNCEDTTGNDSQENNQQTPAQ